MLAPTTPSRGNSTTLSTTSTAVATLYTSTPIAGRPLAETYVQVTCVVLHATVPATSQRNAGTASANDGPNSSCTRGPLTSASEAPATTAMSVTSRSAAAGCPGLRVPPEK